MSPLTRISAALLGVCLSASHGNAAPAFTFTDSGLPGLANSSVAWGDMNHNGRLDLILTGTDAAFNPLAQVWENLGNNQYANQTAGLPGLPPVSSGSAVWGDYDNDGNWDMLLTGYAGQDTGGLPILVAQVWRNLGNGGFAQVNAGLPGTDNDAAAWGDFDNDGDLDLLLSGFSKSGAIAQIWRNDGPAGFVNSNAGLTGVLYSSVALGDFDDDGRTDILLAGTTNGYVNGAITQVWRNAGGGVFTRISTELPGVTQGAVAWGDFDHDQRLDILVTGYSGAGAISQIWRNLGNGTFAMTDSGLPGVSQGGLATGDYDNDGNLDVLLGGVDADTALLCEVWQNQGNATFRRVDAGLPGVRAGALAWADFNNDGRLDILVTGYDVGNQPITRIYQNHSTSVINPKPLLRDPGRHGNGDFQFTFEGKTGLPYLIWSSADLTAWTTLGAAREASPGRFQFRDSQAAGYAARYYRMSCP